MKIFVSWSGTPSHKAALLIRQWLVRVLQYSDPFVSSQDISKGAQWLVTISDELRDTSEGIVCVTPDNVEAPWLNYEAGALAKTTGQTAVRTVLLGLGAGDLPAGVPLSNFQHTKALDEAEMWSLIESIHTRHGDADAKSIERVRWAFDQAWPELKQSLGEIDLNEGGHAEQKSGSEEGGLIRDVLQEVKDISMALAALRRQFPPDPEPGPPRRWRSTKNVSAPAEDIEPGDTVEHATFGFGTVRESDGFGDEKVVRVEFASGDKRLLVRYAPLRKVTDLPDPF